MCKVLNKHHAGVPTGAIYIGRGSRCGNPFRIGQDSDRAAVIAKYERWLADQYHLLRALDELRGHNLVCFCAPRACHVVAARQGRGVKARQAQFPGIDVRNSNLRYHVMILL